MFWEEMRREHSVLFQFSINLVSDVAKIIQIKTNQPKDTVSTGASQ